MTAVAVICKEPVAGRVKTRLCPPFAPAEAAALAEASLRDTFDALRATPRVRRVAVLDGAPGDWLGDGIEVVEQAGGGLDERLARAFETLGGPTLIVGMDTPQVTPELLGAGARALERSGAVLGAAADGGYWAIGLARPDPRLLLGVPMSTAWTGRAQRERLRRFGLRCAELPVLVDVDDAASARAVAASAPATSFACVLAALGGAEAAA